MDIQRIIMILIALVIIGGGLYLASKYFMKPVINNKKNEEKVNITPINEENSGETFQNREDIQKPVNIEDTSLKPYFDISIDNNFIGRIVFQLFDEECPKTCKNFRYLCSMGLFDKSKPSYQDSIFHRVIKDFMI